MDCCASPVLSDQFVEGVQPASGVQLRLVRAKGRLGVWELARQLAEAPLATLHSQEKRVGSPVDELQTKVGHLACSHQDGIAVTRSNKRVLQVWVDKKTEFATVLDDLPSVHRECSGDLE
ncbi:hypothetical protein T265_09998 [Opisthorchis viverrini]|uniref:Uncharacterized protein n=1 Tax=Opisthorchis viverrini TaxID=6198 RepID=A0A074Z3V3_OPIVI|nr:hypothetical protein T265_09998 [Opisthorchis viverrini]KER21761.1 hypothetical protein T265_09998 [Opisthorchis viverrini]